MKKLRPLDIALVGIACRFPGAANVVEFWENIVAGVDATGDVPPDRWDPAVFFDPSIAANDRVYCRRGGYLKAPVPFDCAAHGIMPRTVAGGEPEQFLVLDAARAALADAGLAAGLTDGRRAEVVIGRGNYFNRGNLTRLQHGRIVAQTLAILRALHPEWTEAEFAAVRTELKASLPPFGADTIAGQVTNATSGRLSNRLDFKGASFVVDAASASSLVALDLGARSLVDRRADLAIVGGVYLEADVDFPMVFTQLGALSRSGHARPFSKGADGTLAGEGVGVVVMKRLADAEREGNRIYAVLKGVGLSSDGRGVGLASPSARGHARAMRRAYRRAGVESSTVGLVEGHGLGVPASDRAELVALNAVFSRPERGPRALGSVSSMIGHAMPAAGMAGLIKAALALYHRVLPPTLHAEEPHALLQRPDSPFALNPITRPWIHGDPVNPRRAGVNAFGFAGVNAHAVLEEHSASADAENPGCLVHWESEAIFVGAPDRAGWLERADALLEWLDKKPGVALKDIAYTLNTASTSAQFRVGLVATSLDDLRALLETARRRLADSACRSLRDARGIYFWEDALAGPGRLAFMFPGEGSQYHGMLGELCLHFSEVRARFDTADRVSLARNAARLPSVHLFGSEPAEDSALWSIETAIAFVVSAQWGLYQLLSRLDLRPDAIVGHSSGEIVALAAAGVTRIDREFEDLLGELGTVFEERVSAGEVPLAALMAVAAGRERVQAICREWAGDIEIAMDNCPHQVVLAGPPNVVADASTRLRAQGILCEELPFARAYHTPAFAPALGPVREFFHTIPFQPPSTALYSCAIATRPPEDPEALRELAINQWARPVAFRETIERMYADGVRLFVEVGARGNLTGFVDDTLRGRPHFAVAANLPRRSDLRQLNHLIAALYAQGVSFNPEYLYARRRPERIDFQAEVKKPAPRAGIAIGFPEMHLSEELIQALRARHAGPGPASDQQPHLHEEAAAPPLAFQSQLAHAAPSRACDAQAAPSGSAGPNGDSAHALERLAANLPAVGAVPNQAMHAYLETMDQFLETQRQVMDAYLGLSPIAAPNGTAEMRDAVALFESPQQAQNNPGMLESIENDIIDAAEISSAPPTARPTLERMLLEKVAQRTGYPLEMLQLDLDLEADLGIDSIKRVEILGDLQTQGLFSADLDLDRLATARTLRKVLEVLEAPRANDLPAPPGPWVGEIKSFEAGRDLVSVRMLDLHTDAVAEHHTLGGRRVSALEPARRGLPVLPFTVMAEMLAEAAALLVPGRVLCALHDVQAHKWIRYEEEPIALEIKATRDPGQTDRVRVSITNRGTASAPRPTEGPVVVGFAVFGESRPEAPLASEFMLPDPGRCRFTAEELYHDQWLFHGPALQALVRVGQSSLGGIEGTLRVLPLRAICESGDVQRFCTDPIVIDSFTHLLGCWGLDKLPEGDVIFPLKLGTIAFFGADPCEGEHVECRIKVKELKRSRVLVDAELVRQSGTVWIRITDWEDWRFYWPGRYRDHLRSPSGVFISEVLDLAGASASQRSGLKAVWLEPPADFGRPVWRDVLEWIDLGPPEREALRAEGGAESRRTQRLWGRVAAKEAVRRLWLERREPPVFPADLVISADEHGKPQIRLVAEPQGPALPAISIAHTDGVAVALAALDPRARVGIDVERVEERSAGFEAKAFSAPERALLDSLAAPRSTWVARFWCAKEAMAKATGFGLRGDPANVEILEATAQDGAITVQLGPELANACPALAGARLQVYSQQRGDYVWAWTIAEGIQS